ncbi:hypothetical protein [Brevundimonas sp.]|uniref:hypothetical protein n=1 Tax=Brevundimonas sp. TaxID=1871086 RepID=UPI0025F06077|nr:hypothetical protein [Brevundimonas sp.]
MPDYALTGCGDSVLGSGAVRRWVSSGESLSFVLRRPSGRLHLTLEGVAFDAGQSARLELSINRLAQPTPRRQGDSFSWRLPQTATESWIRCVVTSAPNAGGVAPPAFGFERILVSEG